MEIKIDHEKIGFYSILSELDSQGKISSPRGLKVKEIENHNYKLYPYQRFCSFNDRNLNVKYIKEEFKWYLKGDLHDTSICEHASLWKSLVNESGTINSNYGHYIFASGAFYRVMQELKNDKDSRRASITILNNSHLELGSAGLTKDVPCTYSINFRIREGKLNMTVRMRSQDVIFGMGNDAPAFSFIHEMMFVALKEHYEGLVYGEYYHSCDSFHIYERHFDMLDRILTNREFTHVECPRVLNRDEVDFLIKADFTDIPEEFKFAKWLNE